MSVTTAVAKLAKIYALPGAKVEPSFLGQPRQNVLHPYTSSNISFKSFRFLSACGQSGAMWPMGTMGTASSLLTDSSVYLRTEKRLVANSLNAISWWVFISASKVQLYIDKCDNLIENNCQLCLTRLFFLVLSLSAFEVLDSVCMIDIAGVHLFCFFVHLQS